MRMQSFVSYSEYTLCFLIALTHKKIALCLIVATHYNAGFQDYLQMFVLALTGIGTIHRMYIDNKNKNNNKPKKK